MASGWRRCRSRRVAEWQAGVANKPIRGMIDTNLHTAMNVCSLDATDGEYHANVLDYHVPLFCSDRRCRRF